MKKIIQESTQYCQVMFSESIILGRSLKEEIDSLKNEFLIINERAESAQKDSHSLVIHYQNQCKKQVSSQRFRSDFKRSCATEIAVLSPRN